MISPRIVDYTNTDIHWRPRKKLGIQFDIATEAYLISTDVWQKLGGFNEKFVMYFEDLDFLIRLRGEKLDGTLTIDCSMAHYGSATTKKMIFVPSFFPIRNAIWILKIDGLKLHEIVMSRYIKDRIMGNLKSIYGDSCRGNRISSMLKAFFLFLGIIAGLFTSGEHGKNISLESSVAQKKPKFLFRLK
jgi:GT2 family glycosyltransferase